MNPVGIYGQDIIADYGEVSRLTDFNRAPDIILVVLPSSVNGVGANRLFDGYALYHYFQ